MFPFQSDKADGWWWAGRQLDRSLTSSHLPGSARVHLLFYLWRKPSANILLHNDTTAWTMFPQARKGISDVRRKRNCTGHVTESQWYLRGKLKYHILCFIRKTTFISIYTDTKAWNLQNRHSFEERASRP